MTTGEKHMAKDALHLVEELIGPMTVGRLIRVARRKWEMDQKQLAKKLGVTIGYVSNIETGKKLLSLDQLLKICKKLEQSERVWMTVYFEEEAKRAGKVNYEIKILDKKRA